MASSRTPEGTARPAGSARAPEPAPELAEGEERAELQAAGRAAVVRAILHWYRRHGRHVPWRGDPDPYRIWVGEVMAQQTRMETVGPFYRRFLERFPDVRALAQADLDAVLKAWEGLGYYARARHLHAAARRIVERHAGALPTTGDGLRALPGVGPYTAGAIGSLAFGLREPAIDGNVRRVLSRLFDIAEPGPRRLREAALALLDAAPEPPGAVNQALMDLGSAVCLPRDPSCTRCPAEPRCLSRARGTVPERPPARRPRSLPGRRAAACVVRRGGRVLVGRRPRDGLLGGLWDFPQIELDGRADPREALMAGIAADTGLVVGLGPLLVRVRHAFTHFRLELEVHEAQWREGRLAKGSRWRWVPVTGLSELALPAYLRQPVAHLVQPD